MKGEEVFRAGVNAYLKAHAFGNVTAEDFWNAQAKASGKPIDRIMPTFIDQPGVPLIQIEAKQRGSADLRHPFAASILSRPRGLCPRFTRTLAGAGLHEVGWPASTGTPGAQCVLLTERTQTFKLQHLALPVIANAGEKGYYRVAYSPEVLSEFDRIAETALTPAERIGLVNDVWAMVSAGMSPVGDYPFPGRGPEERPPASRGGCLRGEAGNHRQGYGGGFRTGGLTARGSGICFALPPRNWAGNPAPAKASNCRACGPRCWPRWDKWAAILKCLPWRGGLPWVSRQSPRHRSIAGRHGG